MYVCVRACVCARVCARACMLCARVRVTCVRVAGVCVCPAHTVPCTHCALHTHHTHNTQPLSLSLSPAPATKSKEMVDPSTACTMFACTQEIQGAMQHVEEAAATTSQAAAPAAATARAAPAAPAATHHDAAGAGPKGKGHAPEPAHGAHARMRVIPRLAEALHQGLAALQGWAGKLRALGVARHGYYHGQGVPGGEGVLPQDLEARWAMVMGAIRCIFS